MENTVAVHDSRALQARASTGRFVVSVVALGAMAAGAGAAARSVDAYFSFISVAVLVAVVAVVIGILRNQPTHAAMWWFVVSALLSYLGSVVVRETRWSGQFGSLPLTDVFRIAGYAIMLGGVAWWMVQRRSRVDMTPLIDGVLISLAVLLVTWVLFLSPVLSSTGTPEPAIPAGFYPAINAGMLTLTLYLVYSSRFTNRSVLWMSTGFATFFVGDMAGAIAFGGGSVAPAWLYDITYGVGVVSFAGAALSRSMVAVGLLPLAAPPRTRGRGALLLALLATCALVPLLVTARNHPDLVFRTVILTLVVLVTFLRGERALRRAQLSEDRARHDAAHDPLTGLPNRGALERHVTGHQRTVLFVDLDNFKIVNDSYGHRVGDDLIAAVARRIRSVVDGADVVVRYAGDEFVVLTDLDQEEAEALAHNVVGAVGRPYDLGSITAYVTASIGIARGADRGGSAGLDDVIREADTAMYRAKSLGAGSIAYFDESMRQSAVRTLEIATDLRGAVDRGEFEVFYQPIVSTRTRETVVFEALVRWHHDGAVMQPAEFVPVAESTDLIGEIGAWVLDTAVADVARMRAAGMDDITMSVNVSALQLRDDRLPDQVRGILARHGVDGSWLSLEVTESTLVADSDRADSILARLAAQGILIVLDDFGTGYSSFDRLRSMPITVLKIDKSFVDEVVDDDSALSLLVAITSMADALSIGTVAEGVETEQQLAAIVEVGCRFAQGYLFGRPAPIDVWLPPGAETASAVRTASGSRSMDVS